jgi:phage-related protein
LPHFRAFGDGLFELRPRGRSGIGRAFYGFKVGKRIVVLHAFIKKTQQTPDRELKLAKQRLKTLQKETPNG